MVPCITGSSRRLTSWGLSFGQTLPSSRSFPFQGLACKHLSPSLCRACPQSQPLQDELGHPNADNKEKRGLGTEWPAPLKGRGPASPVHSSDAAEKGTGVPYEELQEAASSRGEALRALAELESRSWKFGLSFGRLWWVGQ